MPIDWGLLRRLAGGQADHLTRRQCLAAGMTEAGLKWRVDSRRWERVHEGVFLTKPGRADWHSTSVAALLRVDSGRVAADAALSGRSAAYLWGLEPRPPAPIELVVPLRRSVVAPGGVRVRRSSRWDDLVDDLAYPWRTTVAATVMGVASRGTALDALALVARAVHKELVGTNELRQELRRWTRHRHSRLLTHVLADVDAGAQSGAEVLFIRDVERVHGLPTASRQAPSDARSRRYRDNVYDAQGLVVEVDGRLGHELWSDRVRDGRRDREVLAVDRVSMRVFWADVALTPCRTAVEIAAVLTQRGWSGRPRRCRLRSCEVPRTG